MAEKIRSVLVVGLDRATYARFEGVLQRSDFDVDRVLEMESALALLRVVAFDVVVLPFPLRNGDVAEVLAKIRAEGAPCRRAAVLVIAAPKSLRAAREAGVNGGYVRVLSSEIDDRQLQQELSHLLRVTPRVGVRLTVRLEVQLGEGPSTVMTQTENLSRGGFLARLRRPQDVGTHLRFELLMPAGLPTVRGEAEVVRLTRDARGMVTGVGLKYLSFAEKGEKTLTAFLTARLPSDSDRENF